MHQLVGAALMLPAFGFLGLFVPNNACATGAAESKRLAAEYEYGLYDSVINQSKNLSSAQDSLFLAKAFFKTQQKEKALAILSNYPRHTEALLFKAFCFVELNQADSACLSLAKYLEQSASVDERSLLLDTSLQKIADAPCWSEVRKLDWKSSNGLEQQFEFLLAGRNYDGVLDLFYEKKSSQFAIYAAKAFSGLGQPDDAIAILENSRRPVDLEYRWSLEISAGKYKEAEETASLYALKRADEPKSWKMQGISLLHLDDTGGAIAKLERYLEVYYMDIAGMCWLARAYGRNGDYLEALRLSNQALKYTGNHAEVYKVRGDIFSELRNWEFAVKAYSLSLDLVARDGEGKFKLGVALLQLGEEKKACYEFRLAQLYGSKQAAGWYNSHCYKQ